MWKLLALKLRAVGEIVRHFRNPGLVLLVRLGCLKVPLFLYRIAKDGRQYDLLARPTASSLGDLFVLREVLVEETYGEILPLLPAGPLRVLDIGANLGSFTIWLHCRHGVREAFCFEPEPTSFNLCRFNLAHNGCAAAQPLPAAVGGRSREITMRVNTNRPGGNSIYASAGETEETARVKVIGLAEWLAGAPGLFDVLKLDCEGAEWEMIAETPPALFQRFGLIVAEVHLHDQPSVEPFKTFFERLGFRTVRWDGHSHGLYIGQRAP
jgi:FkbM family methyltransferase